MLSSAGELWLTASSSQARKAPGFFQLFTPELIATILAMILGLLAGMCLDNGPRIRPDQGRQPAPIVESSGNTGNNAAAQARDDSIGATR